MDLSSSLISDFAKVTNDKPKTKKESTVYGTTIKYEDKMYVKIDGSDLLTPITTTADIKENERVTIMIKDHNATVTGNITSPSASSTDVKKVTEDVDAMDGKVTEFETIVSDKVSTEELDAEIGRIDELIAGKATIEELEAVKATIKDLDVTHLKAEIAEIEKAVIGKADITELNAVSAKIEVLEANFAEIGTLIGGNLTMDNIQSLILTSSKVTVEDAFIKDAMIDSVSANKINAGTINTNLVNVQSADGSMRLTGSLQQFRDSEGNVRIQIGKDTTGDFTFALYGADGQGQLINQNGITASAIGDGLIVNDMVSDDAAISGGKLDIDSVITEVNENGTTTIKGSKIYLDDKNQSLDIAFNTMSTTVDGMNETIKTNTTSLETQQGKIEGLISNTTITKEDGSTVSLKDDYADFKMTVDGISSTVSSLETNYKKTLKRNITEYYMSTSSTTPTGGTWSVSSPVWTDGLYVWQRLVYIYTDDTRVDGTPVCIQGAKGPQGSQGAAGTPGKGLVSNDPQYYASTSYTSMTGGSWMDTCPDYTAGKYLWIRFKMVWSNPTSTTYTNPYYDPSWDAKNTADSTNSTVVSKISEFEQTLDGFETNIGETIKTEVNVSLGELSFGGVNLIDDSLLMNIPANEQASTVNYDYIKLADVEANVEYVLSIGSSELKLGAANKYDIRLFNHTTGTHLEVWSTPISTTKQIIRFTPTEACSLLAYAGPANATIGNLITLNKVKLETGTICSEWTPSQNDEAERLNGIENMFNIEDTVNIYDDQGNIIDTVVRMTNIVDKLNTTSQTLDSTIERISATEQLLSDDGEYGYIKNKFSEYIQTLEGFDWSIGSTVSQNGEQIERILTNISFSEDGITIGKSTSAIKMVIGNDKAAFVDSSGVELAYFSDDRLMITDASILGDLRIGNYGFFDDDGGIAIGKIR